MPEEERRPSEGAAALLSELDNAEAAARADRELSGNEAQPGQKPKAAEQPIAGASIEPVLSYTLALGSQKLGEIIKAPAAALTDEEAGQLGAAWAPIVARYLQPTGDEQMAKAISATALILGTKAFQVWRESRSDRKANPEPGE